MKRFAQVTAAISAAFAGLGAALFFQPRSGARRRHAAADVARRQSASVATIVGSSMGAARRRRSDAQLVSDVRAELQARFDPAADDIQVTAHRGTVTLRGEVAHLDDIDAYEAAARAVEPRDVNNLIRLAAAADAPPRSPAP